RENRVCQTGVKIRLPKNYCGLIMGRSSLTSQFSILIATGLLDEDYRGEIGVIMFNLSDTTMYEVKRGDRISQLLIIPNYPVNVNLVKCDFVELGETSERGTKGFGSTGQ
ncbi:MAG: dUTP diphosphatase, partial [Candidatus Omnitrophica bacterium]|nr:dUTP diphosphatase [Candidatus Omnitrophota bacterium]